MAECKHEAVYPEKVIELSNFAYFIAIMRCGDCDKIIGFDWGEAIEYA